jgi:hypothetical protein
MLMALTVRWPPNGQPSPAQGQCGTSLKVAQILGWSNAGQEDANSPGSVCMALLEGPLYDVRHCLEDQCVVSFPPVSCVEFRSRT